MSRVDSQLRVDVGDLKLGGRRFALADPLLRRGRRVAPANSMSRRSPVKMTRYGFSHVRFACMVHEWISGNVRIRTVSRNVAQRIAAAGIINRAVSPG